MLVLLKRTMDATTYVMETTSSDSILNYTNMNMTNPFGDKYNLILKIRFYVLGSVIPVGLVFNCVAFIVLVLSKMRHRTTGHYLIALSVADNVALIGEYIYWLSAYDGFKATTALELYFVWRIDFWCKFVTLLRYSGRIWSSWIVITIVIERYISIKFPLKVKFISTPHRAKIIIFSLFLMAFGLGSFAFFMESEERYGFHDCIVKKGYNEAQRIFFLISFLIFNLLIPTALIALFTCLIIFYTSRQARFRKLYQDKNSGRDAQQDNLNTILLAVGGSFVLCHLPYTTMYIVEKYLWRVDRSNLTDSDFVIFTLTHMTYIVDILNNCINFFLYCLCGSSFR